MKSIGIIWRRDLAGYLRSPVGYVIATCILCIDGLLFNAFAMGTEPRLSADVIHDFFFFSSGSTMVASVFLTMRTIAEERQLHTFVLLHTAPIREVEVVVGKFLSAFLFLAVLTLATVYMPLLVKVHGKVSWGHLAVGYTGLLLLGAACVAIGVFASSLAPNQVVAAAIAAAILVSMLLLWMVARVTDPPLKALVASLALHAVNFRGFMSGVLHLRHVLYYLGVTYFFLLAATKVLEARRWR